MWSTADEVRLSRVEKAIKFLACQVKNIEANPSQETDPVFTASAAFGITSANITAWNAAETDPVFTASVANGITQTDIDNWNAGSTLQDLQSVLGTGNVSNNDLNLINGAGLFATGLGLTNIVTSNTANFDVSTITNNVTLELPVESGRLALVSQIPTGIPQIVRTSEESYDLSPEKGTILITFTGATTILNLPLVAPNVGTIMLLYNGGTGNVTITGNGDDGNVVIDGGVAGISAILTAGSPMTIFNDGVNWITKP